MPDPFAPDPLPDAVADDLTGDAPDPPPPDGDGRTLFDGPDSEDGRLTVVFPQDAYGRWRSQALVRVDSSDGRAYLAQVAAGPYAAPVGLPANASALVITQVEGSVFTPPYYGTAKLRILGELRDGATIVPLYRPRPNSVARILTPDETKQYLNCGGDVRLGRAVGYDDLEVGLRSDEKAHLPRHTLAVGTTGAGKSTFLAGWVEQLASAGFCVLLLDVEGEYASFYQPADSRRILPALADRGLEPAGIKNSYLLVPTDAEASDPDHPALRRFSVDFSGVPPAVAVELLGANEAQTERFLLAYEAAADLLPLTMTKEQRDEHDRRRGAYDDQEEGFPDLRLAHVYDAAQMLAAKSRKEQDAVRDEQLSPAGFRGHLEALKGKANELSNRVNSPASWTKTLSLIHRLVRSKLFDREERPMRPVNYDEMLRPGRVLVYDLAGIDSPAHRNLVISDVLRGVVAAQDRLYDAAPPDAKPKTVVILEEAHEFVGGERAAQMPAVFSQIQRIARRGRKRWLGLAFATQFPQHLPGELFTLCNNRILMRLADEPTVRRLQHSVGGVPDDLWGRLKNLPTGQAIVSAHGIEPALIVSLNPGRCKLRMVD